MQISNSDISGYRASIGSTFSLDIGRCEAGDGIGWSVFIPKSIAPSLKIAVITVALNYERFGYGYFGSADDGPGPCLMVVQLELSDRIREWATNWLATVTCGGGDKVLDGVLSVSEIRDGAMLMEYVFESEEGFWYVAFDE